MNFNWNEFEEGNLVVHCNTEEDTLDFLNKCKERNYDIDINVIIDNPDKVWTVEPVFITKPLYCGSYIYATSLQRVINYGYHDWKTIDWKISKPYRIYELEEGKTYIKKREEFNSNPELYKVKGNELLYYNDAKERWEECLITYNTIKNEIFIVFEENQKEINWAKVPRGTKVQVKDDKEDEWFNRYFIRYNPFEEEYPFLTSENIDNVFTGFKMENSSFFSKHCRIHPSVTIPNEWYKD